MTTKVNPNITEPSHTGFLRISQILRLIPIGKSTWWAWVACGKAPSPVKLGDKTTVWLASDVYNLINNYSNKKGDA
jgi:prophage regulatory protein